MSFKYLAKLVAVALIYAFSLGQALAVDQALVDAGKQIYFNHCMHCHGEKGAGDGHLIGILKVKPADLTRLDATSCVAKSVLGAVIGRHKAGYQDAKMPLLKQALSLEDAYALSAYVETLQR